MPRIRHDIFLGILILVSALMSRLLLLEYTDLVDPTEARYATVAQEMVLAKDWLVPLIPMPEGVEQYMGKPPLHFWITALTYKIFGVDEWTARLPSFLGALGILLIVFLFARKYFTQEVGLGALLVTCSSGLFFFLAGASVTDVTLTALVGTSTFLLYRFISESDPDTSHHETTQIAPPIMGNRWAIASAIFGALAFLTKGPVALVLIGMPIMMWSIIRKDFSWIRRLPWLKCIISFLIVTAPWFIMSEIRSPGFTRYFFWNENIARYLFKNYGDRYGTGHVHPYGSSWLMMFLGFFPWTFLFVFASYRFGFQRSWKWLQSDKNILFTFCWGLSAATFFTFVRQLHPMYLLPGIPGFSLFTAVLYTQLKEVLPQSVRNIFVRDRISYILMTWGAIVVIGLLLKFSFTAFFLASLVGIGGFILLHQTTQLRSSLGFLSTVSVTVLASYIIVIASFSPFINETRSARGVLGEVMKADEGTGEVEVGVITKNSFSHYWFANASQTELGRKVDIQYIDPKELYSSGIGYLIIKTNRPSKVPADVNNHFSLITTRGEWSLFRRNTSQL